ncbi:MAG TPA: hydroxysqualene dehydroxylase HpnE [Xanthobacteraceae bacterium]|jgi:squalene-associated FAD-dependent desaturase|nr:hydroxysqualene dehydroxylase HpnE [Xanthobacteraceae bacterium]
MTGKVHIIGAGLAGLSAAVTLCRQGRTVVVHEATGHIGGRCRSYYDAATGLDIDNGNHLLLSANEAALDFLRTIDGIDLVEQSPEAAFPFADLATDERWTVRINDGRLPWWIFDRDRRVPGTSLKDYLALLPLLLSRADKPIADVVRCDGPLYRRLVGPLLLAALNIDPPQGSSRLAAAIVRETLAAGGGNCRPIVARNGLSVAFVEPALRTIERHGGSVMMRNELRGLVRDGHRVSALDFVGSQETLDDSDAVVLATPAQAAKILLPDLSAPTEFHAIVNLHYRFDPPAGMPTVTGVVNGTAEWVFAFPSRLSVTISAADRLVNAPREELARKVWEEVAKVAGVEADLPPWQIVRERRATFAATPEQNARRPETRTAWNNVYLAGDWTDTGLPSTIEGAIRSGRKAAQHIMQGQS